MTLSSIFAAVGMIRISQETVKEKGDSEHKRGRKIYNVYKATIIEAVKDPKLSPIVLQCIENLVLASIKLESP